MKAVRIIAIAAVGVLAVGGSIASGDSSNTDSGSSSTSSGEKDAGDANEVKDVKVTKCGKDDALGWAEATLAVTNNSSKASDYLIEVTFASADGKTQFGTGSSIISNLAPGQKKSEKVTNTEEVKGKITCKVTSVDRTESL